MPNLQEAVSQLCNACDAVEAGFDFLLDQVVAAAQERKLKDTGGRSIGVTQEEMQAILQARDLCRKLLVATQAPEIPPV